MPYLPTGVWQGKGRRRKHQMDDQGLCGEIRAETALISCSKKEPFGPLFLPHLLLLGLQAKNSCSRGASCLDS